MAIRDPVIYATKRKDEREVFEAARRYGYYEWPREITADTLAADIGISKVTVLEHLRKTEAKLLDS